MKVLIACEESQEVCKAFRELGHEAYSCDIEPSSGGHPEWHIQGDILNVIDVNKRGHFVSEAETQIYIEKWDLMIAHPPCTHLSVSGARWFKEKQRDGRQQSAIDFFMKMINAPIDKIVVENPISIMSTKHRKPDQIIQPWQFGHGETKATCLWLKNLPKLKPTNIVEGRENRIWKLPPSKDRAKLRSKTYEGIAKAFAQQWGK